MTKKVVVFAPHPDDETLGCGGTIARKLDEKCDVSVVFLTDGRHSLEEFGVSAEPTPSEMRMIRREEAVRAMKILGLQEENLLFSDFEDSTLEKNEWLVQKKVFEILRDISPVEVFFPQENEYNPDHRISNKIIRKAIETLDADIIEYQYIIAWSFPFYLFLHLMNESMFDSITSRLLKRNLIRSDISKFLQLKEMAIEEYKSQMTPISSKQKRAALQPSFVKRFLKPREKFFVSNSSP